VRLVLAVLAFSTVVGGPENWERKEQTWRWRKNVSIPELTEAISGAARRPVGGLEEPGLRHPIMRSFADDFNSFWPDARHIGKPTAQQMAEQPITGYKLSQLRRRAGWSGYGPLSPTSPTSKPRATGV